MQNFDKILIVEDNKEITELLSAFLKKSQYESRLVFSGEGVLNLIQAEHFDLILLDLMLPKIQGEALLLAIRKINKIPVIVISAKTALDTKVEVLRQGADDYISKPFYNEEVLARIEAALRRYHTQNDAPLFYDDIFIDNTKKSVSVAGKELRLTAKEYAILELFCRYPSKVFSKANLFESVWKEFYAYDDNLLGVHISHLRKKLKAVTGKDYIKTVWGIGYQLN